MSTPKSVLEMAKKQGAKMVDIKFVDTFGTWQHFSVPVSELAEDSFSDGLGFDGSSIRGWKSIEASDMLAMPDPATDRKSTRLNSSHGYISYAVFCLKKKKKKTASPRHTINGNLRATRSITSTHTG